MLQFFLLIPLFVVAVYSVHSGFKYTRMISNIFLGLKYKPAYEAVTSTLGEKISILDSGGHEMGAILVEKKNADKLLIFCHDSGSTKEFWEKYAYFFPDLGFQVLSVDFLNEASQVPGSPLSQWPDQEEVKKMKLVLHWARTAFKPGTKIVLFGVSKGADIALAASVGEPQVAGVIADGLFSMREVFSDYIRKWAPILVKPNLFGEKYPGWVVHLFSSLGFWYCQKKSKREFVDVEKIMRKKQIPLLMIHGEEDDYISGTHQKFLHRLGSGGVNSGCLTVPKAGHNQGVTLNREAYEKTITDFLRKIL